MRRREFIALFGGAIATWPLAARAQQPQRLARIGYLGLTSAFQHAYGGSDAFLAGLRDLGYVERKNVHIEFRFAEGDEDRLPGLANELVASNVDVSSPTGPTSFPSGRRIVYCLVSLIAMTGDSTSLIRRSHFTFMLPS